MTRPARLVLGLGTAVVVALGLMAPYSPAHAQTSTAPGGPGTLSRFDLARKDCVGTAAGGSKVWYTVANGVLSDVYEPTIDNSDVQSLQYVVTDGDTFTDLQSRDLSYTVAADSTGMKCTVTATSKHGYRLTTTYVTDPARDSVVMHTKLSATPGSRLDVNDLSVYARLDAHVNGNGGGGSDNGGADTGTVTGGVPVIHDTDTVSQATNRTYAVPTFMALTAARHGAASVGYAGTGSDGLQQLDAGHDLGTTYTSAPDGHIVATEDVTPHRGQDITLSLGFGRSEQGAVDAARGSVSRAFAGVAAAYTNTWRTYDRGLKQPARSATAQERAAYWLSANVLKASEDKTFPGATVASLASPWGQAVSAGDLVGGKPVYFGSYREVFARDLYETATGFLADGDIASAQAATRFLFDKQQLAAGNMPRNSLLNGKPAPDTGGDQLDETAYPILMAYLSGLGSDATLFTDHIKPAANYLVAHGPWTSGERWEEQSGYSPSTIAAEIAGLTAAATIAEQQGDTADAKLWQATADHFQRTVKDLTVTSNGPYSSKPYFIRLSKNGDPDSPYTYNLGNGGPDLDQRAVVDGGFQDLVRLGVLSATDADVRNSLRVLDTQIAQPTATGTGYYRYGNDASLGTADGYGDCAKPSQTSCSTPGQPWPTTDTGSGGVWPVLSGERAEMALATGDEALAQSQLDFMLDSASGVGLVPEQVWTADDLAAAPYGSDPATASIGFRNGHANGSAAPLTWAQAQLLRLLTDTWSGSINDRPSITTERYVAHDAPDAVPVTISSPTGGSTVSGTVTVTGSTTPGATVVANVAGTDTGSYSSPVSTTAGADGSYSLQLPVGFGTDVITVTATTDSGTGYAQVSVTGDLVGGTTVLDVTDPTGDDNGPGTYQYPTASDFVAGSYDLTRFQVITQGDTVYLRTTLRTLTPTFGNLMGAQLLDIYVHRPDASSTSTAAPYPSRNYAIADDSAWSQRLEVQGFASPVWVDADGRAAGSVSAVVASQANRTITIAVPADQFGTPGSGWSFSVALAGQDGYSSDHARAFTATPGAYSFGVCASGDTASICSVDPGTVPKVMDVIAPSGVDQAAELNPLNGPVAVEGVPVP
ncbi:glucodextranase DOMON-like domain-containing protein [Flexivirga lutea]